MMIDKHALINEYDHLSSYGSFLNQYINERIEHHDLEDREPEDLLDYELEVYERVMEDISQLSEISNRMNQVVRALRNNHKLELRRLKNG